MKKLVIHNEKVTKEAALELVGICPFSAITYDEATNTITSSLDNNYDRAHLVVTRVRDNVKLVDSDWNTSNKDWTVSIKSWTPGKYTLMFTGNINEQPKATYSYTCALEITQ